MVRQCQSWIGVKSAPGAGSVFEVYLPRAEALQLLADPGAGVDLLLLDLNLPQRSGQEVL